MLVNWNLCNGERVSLRSAGFLRHIKVSISRVLPNKELPLRYLTPSPITQKGIRISGYYCQEHRANRKGFASPASMTVKVGLGTTNQRGSSDCLTLFYHQTATSSYSTFNFPSACRSTAMTLNCPAVGLVLT